MADNIEVVISGGGTATLQTKDNTTYHTPAHQIVSPDGTVALTPRAEDAASGTGHTGIPAMVIRQDTPGNTSGTDGDYEMLQVSAGRLWTSATVTAVVPGTAATSLGKAEDAAHSSGDVGVMALGVANATHTNALSGSDGDYTPIQVDTTGKVGIRGTFAEDAAHTGADLGIFVLAKRTDSAAVSSGTDGDYSSFNVDANGCLWTIVNGVTPGTAATSLGKAEDAAHTSGDVGVMLLGVRNDTHTTGLAGTDGDYTPIGVDASGKIGVRGTFAEDAAHTGGDLGHFVLAVANSTHTNALSGSDGDYTPIAVDTTGKVGIRGTFAEDAAHTSGDLGHQVLAVRKDVSAVTSGTDGDYSSLVVDEKGKLWVHPTIDVTTGVSGAAFTSSDQSGGVAAVTDAPASGKKLVVVDLIVSVDTAMSVTFTEETSGTTLLVLYMAANTTQHIKPTGKLKLATADKKLNVQTGAAGNVACTVQYRSET